MEQKYLKVPQGLLGIVNKNNLWSVIEFYYRLKSLKNDGYIDKSDWDLICYKFDYSKSALYSKFPKLVKLGYAIESKEKCYHLISYDDLWSKLGISNIGKLFKIDIKLDDTFYYLIGTWEMKFALQKRGWIEKKKLGLTQKENEIIPKGSVKKVSLSLSLPHLSIREITGLLGFRSSSTGYDFVKKCEELKLIVVARKRDKNGLPLINDIFVTDIIMKRTNVPR